MKSSNGSVILLEGIEFFAYHGYHDEERVTGAKYGVDIEIVADLSKPGSTDDLGDTVNYETVYNIVKDEMAKPARLLEHISNRINESIIESFSQIQSVKSCVSKYNPPVGGICRRAAVVTTRKRD